MRHVMLNFHGLGTPGRSLEDGEAPYWLSAERFHEILDRAAHYADRTQLHVSFDDGNLSDLTIGAEGLARHGITARFFVLADRIDTPGSLGRAEIADLIARGHRIGSHGAAHTSWREADDATLAREVTLARAEIAAVIGQSVTEAAIPFGRYNARVLRALRTEGYARVYNSDGGAMRPGAWMIARTSPRAAMTMEDFDTLLSGTEPLVQRLRRRLAAAVKQRT